MRYSFDLIDRLADDTKRLVLGNVELLKFCENNNIDLEKLKECSIERMRQPKETCSYYLFGIKKEYIPESKCELLLDIDIPSQPAIVLILTVPDKGEISFETTDDLFRVLKYSTDIDEDGLPKSEKIKMATWNVDYLVNKLSEYYNLPSQEAKSWFYKSKTYHIIMDLDGLFYYAAEKGLWDLLQCEYECRIEDWKMKIVAY